LGILRIIFMIMSLIDYSKYKVQEANFKFWDDLNIKRSRKLCLESDVLPISQFTL